METNTVRRIDSIRNMAKDIALTLFRNDLQSSNQMYASLCARLEKFRPLLGHAGDENKLSKILDMGIASINFVEDPKADDCDNAFRLLSCLVDKLDSMSGMLGLGA